MIRTNESRNEDTQRELERLELRYRHTQDALTSAAASYDSLREAPGASERQLRQTQQRVQQMQKQLTTLIASIERLEEQDDSELLEFSRPAGNRR